MYLFTGIHGEGTSIQLKEWARWLLWKVLSGGAGTDEIAQANQAVEYLSGVERPVPDWLKMVAGATEYGIGILRNDSLFLSTLAEEIFNDHYADEVARPPAAPAAPEPVLVDGVWSD